ncbi:MAG: aspartate aminotransferase [Opitutus sp.]|nr:aspartate aminotransferase [Opitutus sp.]
MPTLLNRRQWLKAAGAAVAATTLASPSRLLAQAPAAAPRRPPVAPGLVRLNYNENPFGPAPSAKAAMHAAVDGSFRYADAEERDLLELLAAREGCRPEQIVMGAGSGEILDVAGFHFGLEKGEIVAANPSYMALLNAADRVGGKAVRVPLNARLEHDLPAMAAAVTDRTSLVYLVNPNNPTGTVCGAAELRDFVRRQSERTTVFIDEAYLEISDDFAGRTCAPLAVGGRNVVVARTFSKIFGLAGMRLGYAVMPEKLAVSLRARMTGSLSIVTLAAAAASLKDPDYVRDTRAKIRAGRDALVAEVKALGLAYAEPQGNFVFFRTGLPVQDFIARMRAEGVEVGRAFPPMTDWARISIGLPGEMAACHRALRRVLG